MWKEIIIFQTGVRYSNNSSVMQATWFNFQSQIDNVLTIFLSESFTTPEVLYNALLSADKSILLGYSVAQAMCVQVDC